MRIVRVLMVLVVLLFYAEVNAQTCVQADLSHPLNVAMTWVDNATDELGTTIERKLNTAGYQQLISLSGGSIVSYTDLTVVRDFNPNLYTYRVRAFNNDNAGSPQYSTYSNEACITFAAKLVPIPAAPTGLQLSVISSTSLQASWRDNSDNEDKFRLVLNQYSPARQRVFESPANSSNMVLAGLVKNKTYCGRIFSVVGTVLSVPSNDACVTTPR